MKSFVRKSVLIFAGILVVGLFSACSQDESGPVKSYNNRIVEIQKDMFGKAQEASKVFEKTPLETQQIMTALLEIKSQIQQSHDLFKAMEVPKGAERLADAMGKFFQVELNGLQNVINGVDQLRAKEGDPDAYNAFTDTFKQFSSQESQALKDFYATQQAVAGQYGENVVQVEK